MHSIVNWLWVFGAFALLFAWYKTMYVNRQATGTERMAEISSYIREGAIAFLKREYSVLAIFATAVAVLSGSCACSCSECCSEVWTRGPLQPRKRTSHQPTCLLSLAASGLIG